MTSLKIWCFISIVFLVTLETHAASIKQQSPSKPERKLDFDRFHEVDVFSWGTWYQGRTIGRIIKKRTVLIKYIGYNSRSNVWLPENSDRLAPRGTHVQWKGDELDLGLNAELDVESLSEWTRGRVIARDWHKRQVKIHCFDRDKGDCFWASYTSRRLKFKGTHVKWERDDDLDLALNAELDVYSKRKWYRGLVIDIDPLEYKVKVHYIGWDSKNDHWLPDISDRLAPKGTRVKWSRDDDLDLSLKAELDVFSNIGVGVKWYRGRVIDINQEERKVKIHYISGDSKYGDHWLPDISDRLAPKGTRVKWGNKEEIFSMISQNKFEEMWTLFSELESRRTLSA
eukprot:804476_1